MVAMSANSAPRDWLPNAEATDSNAAPAMATLFLVGKRIPHMRGDAPGREGFIIARREAKVTVLIIDAWMQFASTTFCAIRCSNLYGDGQRIGGYWRNEPLVTLRTRRITSFGGRAPATFVRLRSHDAADSQKCARPSQ